MDPRRRASGLNGDLPCRPARGLAWLALGAAAFAAERLLGRSPALAEALYGARVGPTIAWVLSRITGAVPFSIAEVLIVAYAGVRTRAMVAASCSVLRRQRSAANALTCLGLVTARDTGAFVALFYALWGMGYARAPLEVRLGWPPREEMPAALVVRLAEETLQAANSAYLELHGAEDAGTPTRLPEPEALEAAIEQGWCRVAREFRLPPPLGRRYGRAKRLLAGPLLARMGLSGFYSPLTGEAGVIRGLPAVSYPQVLAHEKSHQRGIHPEDEANFFGFLAALKAPDPHARYSALLFAHRQLLAALRPEAPQLAEGLRGRRLPGVQRDIDDLLAYWRRHAGRLERASRRVNDAFLRTNRVEGGVRSYGRSVELLVAYAATRAGHLAAPLP